MPELAYDSLTSLMDTIEGLLRFSSLKVLKPAFESAVYLRGKLQWNSQGVVDLDEQMIMEAARKLEDAIEFSLLSAQPPTFSFNLDDDINCFIETAKERNQIITWKDKQSKPDQQEEEEEEEAEEEEEEEEVEMVGLCDLFLYIRHKVLTVNEQTDFNYSRENVIWLEGMAGVGKTALAKKVFHDPSVKTEFKSRAFVRVGLNYGSSERIVQALTDQLNLDNGGMTQKSLVVLDDVWEPHLLYSLHDSIRSKEGQIVILVTSRIHENFGFCYPMAMRLMDEVESWELLRRKVFGEEEYCPPQLVKPGKEIAEKCEGLPLLINAVAPILLSKAQKDPESWNTVAQKPDSILEEASHQISQVLLISYYQLVKSARLCFLYIASFPLSCVVPRSTITNLWRAEGFEYHPWTYSELIGKNIVINCLESWSEAQAFKLHCSYWYVSKRVAENNKFLYIIKSWADDLDENIKSHRRLAINENVLLAIKEVHNKLASITIVRSLLCNGPYNQYEVPICWEWKLLRVLRVLTIRFYEFPVEVVKLICLKYLALTCNANLPPSISKLWNLRFLIVHQHLNVKRVAAHSYLPVEIWDLSELFHLEIPGRNLPNPPPGVDLRQLRRLLDVGVESCTKEVLESLPWLKRLRMRIELAPDVTQTSSCFDDISSFRFKSFQSAIVNSTLSSPPPPLLNFGFSLKKLSLSGFGYPWEDMSKIAEIECLEELKLECYAFRGEKWEAKEMSFQHLQFLLIEDTDLVQWTSGDESFPLLLMLTMKNCHKLREIPVVRGSYGIHAGRHVELVDCNPLVETWAKQWYDCSVEYSWKEKVKS